MNPIWLILIIPTCMALGAALLVVCVMLVTNSDDNGDF
jgi:hypothetical protein